MAKSVVKIIHEGYRFPKGSILTVEDSSIDEYGNKWYRCSWSDGTIIHLQQWEFTWGVY